MARSKNAATRFPHKGSPNKHLESVVGQFETDGDAVPVNCLGAGYSIHHNGTGLYTVTLDKRYRYIMPRAGIMQASSGNDAAFVVPSSISPGSATANASFDICTQSQDGTAADLNGPLVWFACECSPLPSPAVTATHT
jgi:hypothetical protein